MSSSKKNSTKIYLPFDDLSIETQFLILKDLVLKFTKENKPIKPSDIANISASRPGVSSTLQFFTAIKWINRERRGEYIPSNELIMYLTGLEKETPKNILCKKLIENEPGKSLYFYIEQKETVSIEEICSYLGKEFNLQDKDKKSVTKLVDLMLNLEVLEDKEGILTIKEETIIDSEQIIKIPLERKEQVTTRKKLKEKGIIPQICITFSIQITPETEDEKLRNCLKIIKEEISGFIKNE